MSGSGVTISGGVGSIDVDPDGLRAAAPLFAAFAGAVERVAMSAHAAAWQLWGVGPGAPLGPAVSAAAATAAALRAEAQQILATLAVTLDAAATGLRAVGRDMDAAASRYELTETGLASHLTHWLGSIAHAVSPAATGLARLPGAVLAAVTDGAQDRSIGSALRTLITDDPQLTDVGITGIEVASPFQIGVIETLLASMYPDGRPIVTPAGQDTARAARTPPRDLAGLLAGTAWRDAHEAETARTDGGEVDVKFLHHPDGSRSVIVDLPGTKDWAWPGFDPDVTNLASNVRAITGMPDSYQRGVLGAMERAGVRPNDHVLLVGHSLGGMVAVQVARSARRSGRFDVTDVLTAGSPIGRTVGRIPAGVQVLALENTHDVVPELDGRANPVRPSVTTVTGTVQTGGVSGNHSLTRSYAAITRRAEVSGDPSVRYFEADAERFLDADTVRTERYVITRAPYPPGSIHQLVPFLP